MDTVFPHHLLMEAFERFSEEVPQMRIEFLETVLSETKTLRKGLTGTLKFKIVSAKEPYLFPLLDSKT